MFSFQSIRDCGCCSSMDLLIFLLSGAAYPSEEDRWAPAATTAHCF
uniref:Uncharacterized protein n=1 Tax=Anguilla anguilla TaxID=7936 RepID=A0A0E9S154_ANGAN